MTQRTTLLCLFLTLSAACTTAAPDDDSATADDETSGDDDAADDDDSNAADDDSNAADDDTSGDDDTAPTEAGDPYEGPCDVAVDHQVHWTLDSTSVTRSAVPVKFALPPNPPKVIATMHHGQHLEEKRVTLAPGEVLGLIVTFADPLTIGTLPPDFRSLSVRAGTDIGSVVLDAPEGTVAGVSDGSATLQAATPSVLVWSDGHISIDWVPSLDTPTPGQVLNCFAVAIEVPSVDPYGVPLPASFELVLEGAGWTEIHHGDNSGTTEFAATLGG